MNTNTTPKISIEAFREVWRRGAGLIAFKQEGGKTFVAEIVWKEQPAEFMPAEPTLLLNADDPALQQLADSLWHVGIRPSQTLGTAGEKQALERHLADMRAIAAKFLQTELPR